MVDGAQDAIVLKPLKQSKSTIRFLPPNAVLSEDQAPWGIRLSPLEMVL